MNAGGLFFESAMMPYRDEISAFGKNWCGPTRYKHNVTMKIAVYKAPKGSDGKTVTVYCTACPARFYRLEMSLGRNKIPFVFTTGSGVYKLAAVMALAISRGMLDWEEIQ